MRANMTEPHSNNRLLYQPILRKSIEIYQFWRLQIVAGGKKPRQHGIRVGRFSGPQSALGSGLGCYRQKLVNPSRLLAGNLQFDCASTIRGSSHFSDKATIRPGACWSRRNLPTFQAPKGRRFNPKGVMNQPYRAVDSGRRFSPIGPLI